MSGSGSAPQLDERAVEAAAREAFWTDDLGGHIKGKHTWDSIPEEGRENYRTMIRAALRAYLAASSGGGELDLTDEDRWALYEGTSWVEPTLADSTPLHKATKVARSKLRARLDREDDEA